MVGLGQSVMEGEGMVEIGVTGGLDKTLVKPRKSRVPETLVTRSRTL